MRETEETMRLIGMAIEETLKETASKKMGFCLIVFEFSKPGISNYVSNAQRSDMIEALKETVDRIEKNEDIPAAIGGVQ